MSRSPYFFVERYNKHTNKYELQHPLVWNWEHTDRVAADLFPYDGCHELFSIVEGENYDFPQMRGIHGGLPDETCEEIQKAYKDCSYDWDIEGEKHTYTPNAHWFTYADMYIYCLEYPIVPDYEAEYDEGPLKTIPTPLKSLMDRVDAFLEIMDGWDWRDDYSRIRIVYWIQ